MGRRDAEREVIVVDRGGSSLWSVLVGAAVGAGLALLFAPQSGMRTRRALSRKIAALRETAEEAYDEFTDALHPDAEDEDGQDGDESADLDDQDSLDEAPSKAPVASGRRGGSPARRELEKRLAAARARRQRALAEEDEEPVA